MPNLVSFAASIAELAHGEKSHTHTPSLFDATGTEACASEKQGNNSTYIPKHKRETGKTALANVTNYTLIWYGFYYLRSGNGVGLFLQPQKPIQDNRDQILQIFSLTSKLYTYEYDYLVITGFHIPLQLLGHTWACK